MKTTSHSLSQNTKTSGKSVESGPTTRACENWRIAWCQKGLLINTKYADTDTRTRIHCIRMTRRTRLAGQVKQTCANIWKNMFAKTQTLQWHLHVAKGSTVQFHAQEVIWEIGNFTLTGGPGCRCAAFPVSLYRCAGRAAKRRGGARKIAILSSQSPDHLADQFRSATI